MSSERVARAADREADDRLAQARSRGRRRGWVWWGLALLVIVGGGYWWFGIHKPATQTALRGRGGATVVPVSVTPATVRDVPIYLDGLGTVQASATVTVKPMISGTLLTVNFREGQEVRKGDVLATIDPRLYQAALDQAKAKKQQDESLLANARVDLARYEKLAATAYTSAQQAATQKALVAQDVAQVAQDEAQIETAQTNLSYCTIAAPIDGRTGIRQVDPGNIVQTSDTNGIVVVTTLRPISVQFTLPQQDLPQVAAAMAAGRTTGAAPEVLALPQSSDATETGQVLDTGTLTVLDNEVDPTTGTIKLKASFPNPGEKLWPGAFVTVRLRVATVKDAVVVPPVAVQRGPAGAYLYVLNADDTVTRRTVTEGHEDLTAAIITKGLAAGEKVVTDGASRLADKTKVSVLPPPGTAPVAAPAAAPAAAGRRRGTP
jgi:multidrug efflux system membrane fusion protein